MTAVMAQLKYWWCAQFARKCLTCHVTLLLDEPPHPPDLSKLSNNPDKVRRVERSYVWRIRRK